VWLVPEEETRQKSTAAISDQPRSVYRGYWSDMREGWSYIVTHAPVATILGINIVWAIGGGAINLIADRLGALVFAGESGIGPDSAVAALYFAGGFGLFIGMMIARRVGAYFELKQRTIGFIGWSLLIQGIVFGLSGVMPTLVLSCVMLFVSRVLLGAEFAVQETLLMRLVPDNLRGRVSTTDRAGEMLIWTFSTAIAGWSLHWITPRSLTVVSGLLSGVAGIVWLMLFVTRRVRLPKKLSQPQITQITQITGD
jgi:MFS family permease